MLEEKPIEASQPGLCKTIITLEFLIHNGINSDIVAHTPKVISFLTATFYVRLQTFKLFLLSLWEY